MLNYGIDECRFTKPVYPGTTIGVKLTVAEKIDQERKNRKMWPKESSGTGWKWTTTRETRSRGHHPDHGEKLDQGPDSLDVLRRCIWIWAWTLACWGCSITSELNTQRDLDFQTWLLEMHPDPFVRWRSGVNLMRLTTRGLNGRWQAPWSAFFWPTNSCKSFKTATRPCPLTTGFGQWRKGMARSPSVGRLKEGHFGCSIRSPWPAGRSARVGHQRTGGRALDRRRLGAVHDGRTQSFRHSANRCTTSSLGFGVHAAKQLDHHLGDAESGLPTTKTFDAVPLRHARKAWAPISTRRPVVDWIYPDGSHLTPRDDKRFAKEDERLSTLGRVDTSTQTGRTPPLWRHLPSRAAMVVLRPFGWRSARQIARVPVAIGLRGTQRPVAPHGIVVAACRENKTAPPLRTRGQESPSPPERMDGFTSVCGKGGGQTPRHLTRCPLHYTMATLPIGETDTLHFSKQGVWRDAWKGPVAVIIDGESARQVCRSLAPSSPPIGVS